MQALNEAIKQYGRGLGRDMVKVDFFLNHRIDTKLMAAMAQELADHFGHLSPDMILTVEASGIALAVMTAHALGGIPMVFAKKSATFVQSDDMAYAPVYSFTHKTQNVIRVDRRYIEKGARVLIIDDFLADGQAAEGMIMLCKELGAEVVGVGIGIEKGFMPGGRKLREAGVNLKSLAVVQSVKDGIITLEEG